MDGIDRRIVECLLADGRATYHELGDQVGLSAPAAKRRVDRLRTTGAIRGFTALVDPRALGWSTEAYVEVFCRGNISAEDLRRAWETVPEVVGASTITGAADALLHMLARDVEHLEEALERVRGHRSVDHTESVIVLSRLIDRPRP
jgi:DNA-binding Lrp family transcriptional regulator